MAEFLVLVHLFWDLKKLSQRVKLNGGFLTERPKKGRQKRREPRNDENPTHRRDSRFYALSNPQKMVLLFEAVALTGGWEAFETWKKIGPAKFAGCLFLLRLRETKP